MYGCQWYWTIEFDLSVYCPRRRSLLVEGSEEAALFWRSLQQVESSERQYRVVQERMLEAELDSSIRLDFSTCAVVRRSQRPHYAATEVVQKLLL